MTRSTFFKTLALGLVSAPTLANVLGEESSPFTFRKVSEWQPAPRGWLVNPAWKSAEYEVHFACDKKDFERVSEYFRGITFACDKYPLRFNQPNVFITPLIRGVS